MLLRQRRVVALYLFGMAALYYTQKTGWLQPIHEEPVALPLQDAYPAYIEDAGNNQTVS